MALCMHKTAPERHQHEADETHPVIVLIGQPNCGKSTIFNKVAGYKSISTNFPGATVTYTTSHVKIDGKVCDLVDLPGIYSLTSIDPAAEETKKYLLTRKIDAIINIADASLLSRSLELTLQLLELNIPMLLCLNMIDEAARKGIEIDAHKLSEILHIPVVTTIGSRGKGIDALFNKVFQLLQSHYAPAIPPLSKHVETNVKNLSNYLEKKYNGTLPFNKRLCAIKLLEGDPFFTQKLSQKDPELEKKVEYYKRALYKDHDQPADIVISADRHALSMDIFEKVARVRHAQKSWKDNVDNVLMHPIWGYVFMALFLLLFFDSIFRVGAVIEGPILNFFENFFGSMIQSLGRDTLLFSVLHGLIQGFSGGIAIVLPYLLPFLIGMAFIEDIGYLPRIAFLMDSFMHKIGLHGTAVIPGMLGYGCSVPAVLATRILPSPRDRFIATVVSVLIPCSARMTVIFGLVGYYLGGIWALGIYLLNIVVISITGTILSKMMPLDTPGMVLEMPSYQMPTLNLILSKTWLRMKDFIVIAWPLLIIGSIVLSLAEWYGLDNTINAFLSPLTALLGLPDAVGTTLIFGVLRKELSMLMLIQALGTSNISTVMTNLQILVFTLFITFYVPCLATIGIMGKEIGWRRTIMVSIVTIFIAIAIALTARIIGSLLF